MTEEERYFRTYDTAGNLMNTKGQIFQQTFFDTIVANKGVPFSQEWVVADISHIDDTKHMEMNDINMYYVISDLSGKLNITDTIRTRSDSTGMEWRKSLKIKGAHKFQAVAYLLDNNNIEMDTSHFTVMIKEENER